MHIVHHQLRSVYAKASQDNYCSDLSYKTIEAFRQGQFDDFVSCMDNNLQAFEDVFKDKLMSESLSVFQDDAKGRIPRFKNQSQDDYDLYGEYDINTILNTPRFSEHVLDYSLYRIHHLFYRCASFGIIRPDFDLETIERASQWFIDADLLDFNQIFSNFTAYFNSSQNGLPLFSSFYHHYLNHFTHDNHGDTSFLPDTLDLQTWKQILVQIKIIDDEKTEKLIEEKIPLLKQALARATLYQRLNAIDHSEENKSTTEGDELSNSINNIHKIKI